LDAESRSRKERVGKNKKTMSMKTKILYLVVAFFFLGLLPVKMVALNFNKTELNTS
jgi:hypothetical protein